MSPQESELYEPIKRILKETFGCLGRCHLEDTSRGFPPTIRNDRQLIDDLAAFYTEKDKQFPDLTGYLETTHTRKKEVITVEIKKRVDKIKSIYQAKRYAELFESTHAFLISSQTIPDRLRRFLLRKPHLYYYYTNALNNRVIIAKFDEENEEFVVDQELYGDRLPEPLRTAYRVTGYCFDAHCTPDNLVGTRVVVRWKKVYLMSGWVDDLVRERKIPLGFPGVDLNTWIASRRLRLINRLPTKEELGLA